MNFKLQKINKKMTVVDIEVDESHTFTVGKSKMIVHNCFLPYVDDTKESIIKKSTESRILSTLGGGVGIALGIRPRDQKSTGVMPHLKTYDADVTAFKQGSCYVEGTEVFTDKGFVEFKNLTSEHKIAMVDENRNIHFTSEYETVEQDYDGYVCRFKNKNIDLSVTPNHRMIYSDVDYKSQGGDRIIHKELKEARADSLNDKSALWFGTYRTENKTHLSSLEKFYIALQADGCILKTTNNAISFRFKKERKKESLKNILDDLSDYVTYSLNEVKGDIFSFYVKVNDKVVLSKNLNNCFNLSEMTKEKAEAIILECGFWDGSYDRRTENSISYSTIDFENFKFYEYVATISGIGFKTTVKNREHEGRQTQYMIRFFGKSAPYTYSYTKTKEQYTGKVYCAIVPTGMLLVKSNGRTLVCGNTRRGAVAAYLDVQHPEIVEFISVRDPFGGDVNRKSLNIHHGVNLSDDFMSRVEALSTKDLTKEEMDELNTWNTSHSSGVTRKESVKEIYEKILETRLATGEPYLHFIDTSNKHLPLFQKELGMSVKQSNLCLTGDSIIEILYNGKISKTRLDDFVEKYSLGGYHLGVCVKSFDIETNTTTFEEVTFADKTADVDEIFEITDDNGIAIRCTGEHKIYTKNRGYVMAKDLLESDVLMVV